jgi:hypothetical protein
MWTFVPNGPSHKAAIKVLVSLEIARKLLQQDYFIMAI